MRLAMLLVLILLCLSLPALASDNYVVDVSQPLPEGKAYDVTDGEVKIVDVEKSPENGPLIAISLQSESGSEVSIWQFHAGERGFTVGLARPGLPYDPTPAEGVMRITNLAESGAHREESPELLNMLPLGKRYVIENIELVIYAPWCSSFRAYLLNGNPRAESRVLGWIQGSLAPSDALPAL